MSREVLSIAAAALGRDPGDVRIRRALQTTLDLARGLGLADVLSDDSARRDKIVRFWAHTLDMVLDEAGATPARDAANGPF